MPLHWVITVGVALVLCALGAVIGWRTYAVSRDAMENAIEETSTRIAQSIFKDLNAVIAPARSTVGLLALDPLPAAANLEARLARVPSLQAMLVANPLLDAIYVGYSNGDFILARPLRSDRERTQFQAPARTSAVVQTVIRPASDPTGETLRGTYTFLDASGSVLAVQPVPDYTYDPRIRPWFEAAMQGNGIVRTAPYIFYTTRSVGVTLAQRANNGTSVVGVDVTLGDLNTAMNALRETPGTILALVDGDRRIMARAGPQFPGLPPQTASSTEVDLLPATEPGPLQSALDMPGTHEDPAAIVRGRVAVNGRTWQVARARFQIDSGAPVFLLSALPEDELLTTTRRLLQDQLIAILAALALGVPMAFVFANGLARPLRRLALEAEAVRAFDFSPRARGSSSRVAEVSELDHASNQMRETIGHFLQISVTLSSERQLDPLLDNILASMLGAANARAGAIYLVDDNGQRLTKAKERGVGVAALTPPSLPVAAGIHHPVAEAALARDLRLGEAGSALQEAAAAPLLTRDGELVGVLMVRFDRLGRNGNDPRLAFLSEISGVAAVAIETHNLIRAQRDLMQAIIEVIAGAIDAKSPYTGGHCQRVPVIAQSLAEAAHAATEGPLAAFRMSEDDREALYIASWLHDCGKVTTPEFIVDKATKLETVHDRIHEIRMRFELLKAQAEIDHLRRVASGGDAADSLAARDRLLATLDEEFAFVADCNLGGEAMDKSRVARLRGIAARTWTRTLDDRLGISWEEAQRHVGPAPALPVEEPLLADRPEHLIAWKPEEVVRPDNPWGFTLLNPANKRNLGELYNLTVGRGTLTAEDRFIINQHMIHTIVMLNRLPLRGHLAAVPEIAGGHHERMDGLGYPKSLKREDLSVLARIMAIADVFEALTAADRPYKRPNTLDQALEIMGRMAETGHLDADLFALFVASGTARRYVETRPPIL
ncbi:HD domain-containing phosphohydrolase [Zavarzinia sp. CC-PAN008]|uniref:HD domain-containing phosphohydrolase n=1 Tax=Zavarzinia sp. CC-PAN008 TaxID=3243332 RepID=UPI003F742B1A